MENSEFPSDSAQSTYPIKFMFFCYIGTKVVCDANVYLGLETLFIKYKVKILIRKHNVEI